MGNKLGKLIPEEFRVLLKWIFSFLFIFLAIPLGAFLLWNLVPKATLNVIIVDKTVVNLDFQEHSSIHWTLNHLRYVKPNGDFFNFKEDYFGFFPAKDGTHSIKDLNGLTDQKIDELVEKTELIYFSDTYGVYENDLEKEALQGPSKKIYGGMDKADLNFLQKAYSEEITIISEFNTIASPTPKAIKNEFETLVGLKWTGWIVRYFDELDTLLNDELPFWMIDSYNKQHDKQWDLKGSGLVFLKDTGKIEILEYEKHTLNKVPIITTGTAFRNKIGIPEFVWYPYWFDIVLIDRDFDVISYYDINPTGEGLEMLREMGLPRYFPAVVVKPNGKGKFYYFSGDFADNVISNSSFRFYGIAKLWRMFMDAEDYSQRNSFFWNYYFPLMRYILDDVNKKENTD
ncbi:hypothetical protein [Rhodonellum sp.]|uniref:hypothetical protein n=1 Tax=Rhodonellum sp. TaxID=2231180 RepID=UPI00271C3145|nr:hypothetical protein [Rhodonellum sp.]MDO9552987.1 hypothetical protein [Rhodonellum sp.]